MSAFFRKLETFRYYFPIAFVIIFFAIYFKVPSHYKSELFAEAATNFFYHSRYSSFFDSLKEPEVGYFPLFQRILSNLIYPIAIQFPAYIPEFYSISGFICISLFCSLINLQIFKSSYTK